MIKGYKRIKILSEAEIDDLYSLPKFTLNEKALFFCLDKKERKLIEEISDIPSKIYAILQFGYFKARGHLLNFKLEDISKDLSYVIGEYFPKVKKSKTLFLKAKKQIINEKILEILGYRPWDNEAKQEVIEHSLLLARIHANHIDIFREVLTYLENNNISLPGYTILQDVITFSVNMEYARLENIIRDHITADLDRLLSDTYIAQENNPTKNLSILKSEPKNFRYNEVKLEASKALIYSKYYKQVLPLISTLEISPKCIRYYAEMIDIYNRFRIDNLSPGFRKLCFICSIYHKYQNMSDNTITSFLYHNNNFIKSSKAYIDERMLAHTKYYENTLPQVSKLLRFMGEEAENETASGFWSKTYDIIPKTQFIPTANYIDGKAFDEEAVKWEYFETKAKQIKTNMRMLFRAIEFSSNKAGEDVLEAILFLQGIFTKNISLNKLPSSNFPDNFIPKTKRKYLYNATKSKSYDPDKYEIYLYQSIAREIEKGNIFCNESTKYKSLSSDLISDEIWKEKDNLIKKLAYPNISVDINQRLEQLELELHEKIIEVNRKIDSKENQSIKIKENNEWHLTYPTSDSTTYDFFAGVPNVNLSDLLYFVQENCNFCSAFDHIKPRYSKQKADIEGIIACLIANGLSFGTYKISQSSDLGYSFLSNIELNFFSLDNLKAANDIITNKIANLKIFNSWNILPDKLLAGVDGQKFKTILENFQSRYSSKYFGMNKGIVAYSMVLNHVPVNSKIIGANEHESHYLYDIIYNNTSDVEIEAVSGDMHSINKVNFAILDSISKEFMPNFSDPEFQTKSLRSLKPINLYKDAFIKPTKIINKKLISEEWDNIQRIFVSLATQGSSQANIVRKLSSHKRFNRTKTALWEYDAIFRSLHLLNFIDNEAVRSHIRKSQNRIEDYHQLRKAIAKVGTAQFRGKSILENTIWNECSRLVANCIILYNSIMLEELMDELEKQNHTKAINFLKKISPIRWQHIIFVGRYIFAKGKISVKIEDIVKQLKENLQQCL